MKSKITEEKLKKMQKKLSDYMAAKQIIDARIIENEQWYKSEHWNMVASENQYDIREPVTAFLFNAIANKHAEVMDSYPAPNILAREEGDEEEAGMLSKIIPFQLEQAGFRKTYNNVMWNKLKNGTAAYGVFFNPSLNNGEGDVDIRRLDMLNLFWEPGVEDIQDSEYFFIVNMTPNEAITASYPFAAGHLGSSGMINLRSRYEAIDNSNKSMVVDCYYKKYSADGSTVVHMTKFTGDVILDSTEDRESTAECGLYNHGKYPVIFDTLYPIDGSAYGFGMVDIAKNPQAYIDKLDYIISKNAMISGKVRWILREGSGINENELLDLSKDVIHTAGSIREDSVKEFQARPIDSYIIAHRNNKIAELKEILGNRDFNQGGTYGGVTAYGAIVALQEAGSKLSRDIINAGYDSYSDLIYMCIELVRQFFDSERKYRITGEDGSLQYIKYSNKNIRKTGKLTAPVFDISVQPEKRNPFSRMSQNQTALDFYKMGLFKPELADEAIMTLEMMSFEGKEKLLSTIRKNKQLHEAAKAAAPANTETVQKSQLNPTAF
ncbi:MAG: hypothetical protein Q8873_02370 [Bacillota bacterium]|nr:hypothetical protein [Bacillota bacterium]